MGSGGPRGLQIPRSGAHSVRGGFDSHAFPPFLCALSALLLGTALAAAAPVWGAESHAESHADSVVTVPAARDTTRRTLPVKRLLDQPRFVMFRSLAVPGWGQLHNHSDIKAGVVAGIESWLIVRVVQDRGALGDLRAQVDAARLRGDESAYTAAVNSYNSRLEQSTSRQWFLGGALAYALIDAYVDANFKGFDVEFRQDPALPGGPPAEPTPARPGGGGARGGGMRAALRWHF